MSVKLISGKAVFEYTCDLCKEVEIDSWTPANWQAFSIAVSNGGTAQLYICQDCQTHKTITELLNRVNTDSLVYIGEVEINNEQ